MAERIHNSFLELLEDMSLYKQSWGHPDTYKGPGHHGGDLSEHSLWAMYTIENWKKNKRTMTEGVRETEGMLAALFHDIGKGGDCVETCEKDKCWRDSYAKDKYGPGTSDRDHTIRCGDMLMGYRKYIIDCKTKRKVSIPKLIQQYFPNIDNKRLAVAAYMHYEFGLLGLHNDLKYDVKEYVDKFEEVVRACKVRRSLSLLKLCIAVSAADIAGGGNAHLDQKVRDRVPEVYESTQPWKRYGMDGKVKRNRSMIISEYRRRFCKSSSKNHECSVSTNERTYE